MKTNQPSIINSLKWVVALFAAVAWLVSIAIPLTQSGESPIDDYAVSVFFFGIAIALMGCFLIIHADDPITTVNKISVMLFWTMGCLMSAVFLVYVFVDPPAEREYLLGAICGVPSILMSVMAIVLYRHELQQAHTHPFDDPQSQIEQLKEETTSSVPGRLVVLFVTLLLATLIFGVWVLLTVPFPQ